MCHGIVANLQAADALVAKYTRTLEYSVDCKEQVG
jgi:hypothetical protein